MSITTLLDAGTVVPQFQASPKVFTVQKSFDLTALAAVIANADVVDLFTLPAKTAVLSGSLEITTAGTKDATTFTLQLRNGTTAITAAKDATATGIGLPSASEAAVVSTSAATVNAVAAVSGGNALVTANPKIKVTLVCIPLA